jgi:hypothetical protein
MSRKSEKHILITEATTTPRYTVVPHIKLLCNCTEPTFSVMFAYDMVPNSATHGPRPRSVK